MKESTVKILGIVINKLSYEVFGVVNNDENKNAYINLNGAVFKKKENENHMVFNIIIELTNEDTKEKLFTFSSEIVCKCICTEEMYKTVFAHLYTLIRPKIYDSTTYFSCFESPYFLPLTDFSDFEYEVIDDNEEEKSE